jgi:hypothetical protein
MTTPIRGDNVQPENVKWLWRERIPRSMYSMIAGRPDQMKSLMAVTIAADVTKAGGNVLWSGAERAPSLVDHPRFIAAGGVVSRIHYWRFSLPARFEELADHIIDKDIDLVIMDPASAHIAHRSSDSVRENVLNPLTALIEQTDTAVLFVEHALKRIPTGSSPLSAIAGSSSGLPAACAMAFLFGADPLDANNRILACVKHNIVEKPLAIQFEVDTVDVDGIVDTVPSLVYDQEIVFDAMRLLTRESTGKVGRPNDKRAAAAEWLTNYLHAQGGGPVLAKTITEDAKQVGMTSRTLRRAAADMEIVKSAASGPGVTWALPQAIMDLLSDGSDADIEEKGEEMSRHLYDSNGDTPCLFLGPGAILLNQQATPDPDPEQTETLGIIDDDDLANWLNGGAA